MKIESLLIDENRIPSDRIPFDRIVVLFEFISAALVTLRSQSDRDRKTTARHTAVMNTHSAGRRRGGIQVGDLIDMVVFVVFPVNPLTDFGPF
jgi:hypothetical protein